MRKLSFVLPLACLLFGNSCTDINRDNIITTNSSVVSKNSKTFNNFEGDADFQLQAIKNFEKINNYFSDNSINKGVSIDYPDYYGGAYVNASGILVVLIKGSDNRFKKNITDIIGNENVIFESCKNSFKELKNVMSSLNNYKMNPSNNQISKNFNAFALIDSENIVEVELEDMSDAKQKEFKKFVLNNNKSIRFKKSVGKFKNQFDLQPGCMAEKTTTYGSFSFRAKRNSDGKIGMVSSGHVFPIGQNLYYQDTTVIGTCTNSVTSGSVDAAFIPIDNTSSFAPTNTICNTTYLLSTSTSLPGKGTLVNLRGAYTNTSSGYILSTDASVYDAQFGITFTNLTSADYQSAGGDSGGIIYTYVSSTNTRFTVGIHKGEKEGIRYFTKANLALSALNVSRY